MTNISFNQELAIALYESTEDFPVDFDDAYQWLGYSTKQKALNALKNNFEEGMDFLTKGLKPSSGGRPKKSVFLTVECFEKLKAYQESRKDKKQYEKLIQQKLQRKKGGQTEVSTPVGNIDLLTSSEIIEIKDKSNWKSALGQIIAYSYYYPSHRKLICLFGYAHSSYKQTVEDICSRNNVHVEWVSD